MKDHFDELPGRTAGRFPFRSRRRRLPQSLRRPAPSTPPAPAAPAAEPPARPPAPAPAIEPRRSRRSRRVDSRRMVFLAVAAMLVFFAGLAVFVGIARFPAPVPRAGTDNPGTLSLAYTGDGKHHQILEEEARLLDPTPLFLPTPHNYSQFGAASFRHHETGQSFRAYPALYAYPSENFALRFSDSDAPLSQPVDVLDYKHTRTPYATLGRGEPGGAPLPSRLGFVEVIHAKTGRTLLSVPIYQSPGAPPSAGATTAPPRALVSGDLWEPLEFIAVVGATGLVGAPVPTNGPAAPSTLERYFSDYLEKNLHLGLRSGIPPGAYMLRVGP